MRSSTFFTATPADSMALALPPVDTSSYPAAARPCDTMRTQVFQVKLVLTRALKLIRDCQARKTPKAQLQIGLTQDDNAQRLTVKPSKTGVRKK